jgi:hypothetical protein
MKREIVLGIWFMLAVLVLGAGCGDDEPIDTALVNEIDNNLTFTRPDSSEILMGSEYAICCGIWEAEFIDKNTLKILFFDTSHQRSGWKLFLIVDEIQVGETYSFPTDTNSPLKMFVIDASDQNELSSDDDASTGTVTVELMECGPPVRIQVAVDVVLGSAFHLGPPVSVSGSFRAIVYENPASFGCDFSM